MKIKKMLLVVDPQLDFINGSLPVAGAAEAMDALAGYIRENSQEYSIIAATSDWHPYNHSSFDRNGGPWPPHCVQHSQGAALWPSLLEAMNNTRGGFIMLYKGMHIEKEEYSIMQDTEQEQVMRTLVQGKGIQQIDVCGLAGNVCVLNTARDLAETFGAETVNILEEYSPSLDDGSELRQFSESLRTI